MNQFPEIHYIILVLLVDQLIYTYWAYLDSFLIVVPKTLQNYCSTLVLQSFSEVYKQTWASFSMINI